MKNLQKWGKMAAKNLLLGILVVAALSLTIQPLIVSIRTSIFTNHTVNAQLLNDRDSDGIEDDSDPCPDDADTTCTTPETEAQLPGINAPIDQSQGTGGTSQSTPGTPSGAQTQSAEINFCIPNKEACNQTDVLINEAGDLICDPKESDCSAYLNQQPPPEQVTNVCIPENQSAGGAGGEEGEQVTNICPAVPVARTPHSMWKHYPVPDEEGLQQAEEQQQEQDQIDEFACDFAEHASEAVGAFYTCAKVGEEFKDALNDPGKVVSPKEVAFCGFGISGQYEKKVSILDPVGWGAGKLGKLSCKGTLAIKNWLTGESHIVETFLSDDYDRIEAERLKWCNTYGVTPDEFGHCWNLENDYDDCKQRQIYWDKQAPETLGIGKPIKLRDGTEVINTLGWFEYPCSFTPIPSGNEVCAPEESVCEPETSSEIVQ